MKKPGHPDPRALGVKAVLSVLLLAAAGTDKAVFSTPAAVTDLVSTPTTPGGEIAPKRTIPYIYTTGGSVCSGGHPVQYYFDFGDGTNSGWLPGATVSVAKRWAAVGTFNVRAKARCSVDTGLESAFSTALAVNVNDIPDDSYLVLPEVIWAPATGGGTWMTEIQVTAVETQDVWVWFNTAGGTWRGPFLLLDNLGTNQSVKYGNILATLQALDPSFSYYGKVGALQVRSEDNPKAIKIAARTLNGNYSKTFPGLRNNSASVAWLGETMLIQGLVSNATYRSSTGFFNAAGVSTTVEFQLLDSTGSLIGSAFNRTFAAYDFQSFNPFVQAGVPYPASSYDNVCLRASVFSGDGEIIGFGAIANNASNDPSALLTAGGGWTGPDTLKYLPEAIWAPATGGGTWTTDIQITDNQGGTQVEATFCAASGTRGPFVLWTGGNPHSSVRFTNILQTLQALDPSFTYYGKVGAIYFKATQGALYRFLVTAMTKNGNYAKTYPAATPVQNVAVGPGYDLMIQNLASNATYRSSVVFVNISGIYGIPGTAECRLRDSNGNVIGSMFTVTLSPFRFYSVNPFTAAGIPYPANSFDNVWLHLTMPSSGGFLAVYGATANNASNDPASHLPAMYNH